jgi:hypothetical protein
VVRLYTKALNLHKTVEHSHLAGLPHQELTLFQWWRLAQAGVAITVGLFVAALVAA